MLITTNSQLLPTDTAERDSMDQWYESRVANLKIVVGTDVQQSIHFEVSTQA